jgi:hypothetical protein
MRNNEKQNWIVFGLGIRNTVSLVQDNATSYNARRLVRSPFRIAFI